MIDLSFTDLEYPLIEINIDDQFTESKLAIFKENCLTGLEELNIFNIVFDFKSKSSLDQFIASFPPWLERKVNGILRFNLTLLQHFNQLDPQSISGYSDVVVNISSDQLGDVQQLREVTNCFIEPIFRITYHSDLQTTEEVSRKLDYLENFTQIKYIVLNPDYQKDLDFKAFLEIQKLNLRGRRLRVFFDRGSLPARLLRAHPCNGYILSCTNCHYGKKDLPRSFMINSAGFIFPEGLNEEFTGFILGNVFKKSLFSLLDDYWLSTNHHRFKETCERVFHEYVLDFPFGLVPWRYLFYREAKRISAKKLGCRNASNKGVNYCDLPR